MVRSGWGARALRAPVYDQQLRLVELLQHPVLQGGGCRCQRKQHAPHVRLCSSKRYRDVKAFGLELKQLRGG